MPPTRPRGATARRSRARSCSTPAPRPACAGKPPTAPRRIPRRTDRRRARTWSIDLLWRPRPGCARASLVADRDRLPRTLADRFADLLFVLRGHLVLQHVQIVLVVEVEHLRDDAHAHAVALTQSEVDFDFLGHLRTFTGTCFQPTTFCIWTRLHLSKSTS